MNPSATGWIDKFGHIVGQSNCTYKDFSNLYAALRRTGFVYGINTTMLPFITVEHTLTEDEKAKLNLISAMYFTYSLQNKQRTYDHFIDCVYSFYTTLGTRRLSLLDKVLTGKKQSNKLELFVKSRVYIEDNIISKTFNNIITNSVLFIDVLSFKRFLENKEGIINYAQELEYVLINLVHDTLQSKEQHKSDHKLLQLFEASLTYTQSNSTKIDKSYRHKLKNIFTPDVNQYYLDIAALTAWEDKKIELNESKFIHELGKDFGLDDEKIANSITNVIHFFDTHMEHIPHLKHQNMALDFYDNLAKIVNKLILRNSKRLQKELSESKELVALISKSAVSNLTEEEKKKIQNQLLDIFKSIPSLAIFLLPGGAVLLPIFIKLIPKLLPSSFDENRVE